MAQDVLRFGNKYTKNQIKYRQIYIGGTLIRFEHVIDHIIRPLIHLLGKQIHEKLNQIRANTYTWGVYG